MKVIPVMVDMEISGYKLSTFEHWNEKNKF